MFFGNPRQFFVQAGAIAMVAVYSFIASFMMDLTTSLNAAPSAAKPCSARSR
jgi:hypothetical protein